MSYRVDLAPAAARAVERLRPITRLALRGVIAGLADDPRPRSSRRITGSDLLRIRVRVDGVPWRVVYQVRGADRLVIVTRIVRRDEATYRGV